MTSIVLIALIVALLADAGTTIYGIKKAGLREANILPARLMERFGTVPVTIATKLLVFGVGAVPLIWAPVYGPWFAVGIIAIHLVFAGRNLIKIRRKMDR